MKGQTTLFSKASDEWATPQDFFAVLHEEFSFDLDAAATVDNAKCAQWLGPNGLVENALTCHWPTHGKSVWLNPPYSKCREFVAKAVVSALAGCTVVCLVPSRTDTRWWHDYVWLGSKPRPGVEVRFVKGRLKFGGAQLGAPFPSVVVIFSRH